MLQKSNCRSPAAEVQLQKSSYKSIAAKVQLQKSSCRLLLRWAVESMFETMKKVVQDDDLQGTKHGDESVYALGHEKA